MKSATTPLLAAVFFLLIICSAKSQQTLAKYTDYDRGYRYFYYHKWDSALLMFSRYINAPDDSLNKGKAYIFTGEMLWKTGDLYAAQQSLIDALRTLNPNNPAHQEEIGFTYNLLGNVSLEMKAYDEAIQSYNKAFPYFKGNDYFFEVLNGKATTLQKKKDYDAAIALYDSAYAVGPANQVLLARIIDNRARTKWEKDPGYNALPDFWQALRIRADSQQLSGLNASYAHLSDYYAGRNQDSALWYAQKMRALADTNQNPDDMIEALDKLIRLTSNAAVKAQWYNAYKKLNDSLQLSRDTTRNRFALIRYDFQKSKADNLALQQDISRQRLLMYGLIAGAVIIITVLWFWNDKRRKRIKQESENAIRDARLKTSQKVHDVVANGLYGIMNELEHGKNIDREPMITRIEDLYEKSRNISYEDVIPETIESFSKQVQELLNTFAQGETKVIVAGNQPAFWNKVSVLQRQQLYLVLGEIMVNMKKHSQAKNAIIVFKEENNKGVITCKDDGVGFKTDFSFGNGLNNTVSRIKSIGGAINFGESGKEGVTITISFPLKSGKHD